MTQEQFATLLLGALRADTQGLETGHMPVGWRLDDLMALLGAAQ